MKICNNAASVDDTTNKQKKNQKKKIKEFSKLFRDVFECRNSRIWINKLIIAKLLKNQSKLLGGVSVYEYNTGIFNTFTLHVYSFIKQISIQ